MEIKKRLFVIFILGIVVSISLFSALSYSETFGNGDFGKNIFITDDKKYAVKEYKSGWNLIPRSVSSTKINTLMPGTPESEKCDLQNSPSFFYLPSQNKYSSDKEGFSSYIKPIAEEGYAYGSSAGSFWIYFENDCLLTIDREETSMGSKTKLSKGWNFVSATKEMKGKNLGDLTGTCEISSAYFWYNGDGGGQESSGWMEIPLNGEDDEVYEDSVGMGIILKAGSECELNIGSSSDSGSAPSLPEA